MRHIDEVLQSGWLTSGPKVHALESALSEYLGLPSVAAMNSCTASLHIALKLAGVTRGTEVILPSETFVSTANAVLQNGGTPVFAEIDPNTLNIDPNDVSDKINERTSCIIPVHIAGLPCDMERLSRIGKEHNIPIIEDCAHALGSKLNGQACGTFGRYSCFSFYPTKVVGGAEGGLLASQDPTHVETAKILRNQGRAGMGPNEITHLGYNYRMNELQACVILPQVPCIDDLVRKRNSIASMYDDFLDSVEKVELIERPNNVVHSCYSYIIKVPEKLRSSMRKSLLNRGIETSVLYHPVHLQPVYRNLLGFTSGSLPATESVCSRLIALPMHTGLEASDVQRVCDELESALR